MNGRIAQFVAALLAALLSGLGGGAVRLASAQVRLSHVLPGAVAPGVTADVVLHGQNLGGVLKVWTSFPAEIVVLPPSDREKGGLQRTCKVTVGSGVPLGVQGLVVATKAGLSDVLYVMIDDLPSAGDHGKIAGAANAQEVMLPVGIDGLCEGTTADYYRFRAKAGEEIAGEVVATRLGWDFDPVVRVLDSAGRELLMADDDVGSGADPRFVFVAPSDGTYVLELSDNRFKAGGRYRLRLGNFPMITTPLPVVVQRGGSAVLRFLGPRTSGLEALTVLTLASEGRPGVVNISPRSSHFKSAAWSTLRTTDLPVYEEGAGGDAGSPRVVSVPGVMAGWFERGGERDAYSFRGVKGTALQFRGLTRSLGSAAILSLSLRDGKQKLIAESKVTEADEPVLNATLPADGDYTLRVEELGGRGGANYAYAVECRSGPQFALLLKNDNKQLAFAVPGGDGAFTIDVQCQRAGYDGPITLAIESPRSGWQVFNHVIAAKANEGRLYVAAPPDLAAGEIAEVRIVGRGEAGGRMVTAEMGTLGQLRAARPETTYPPAWHEGMILVAGMKTATEYFSIAPAVSKVELLKEGGTAQFAIEVDRGEAGAGELAVTILPVGLPAGVTAYVKQREGAKGTYDVTLKGAKSVVDGSYKLRFVAYAEQAKVGRIAVTGDVRLVVGPGEKIGAGTTNEP